MTDSASYDDLMDEIDRKGLAESLRPFLVVCLDVLENNYTGQVEMTAHAGKGQVSTVDYTMKKRVRKAGRYDRSIR